VKDNSEKEKRKFILRSTHLKSIIQKDKEINLLKGLLDDRHERDQCIIKLMNTLRMNEWEIDNFNNKFRENLQHIHSNINECRTFMLEVFRLTEALSKKIDELKKDLSHGCGAQSDKLSGK
jgi:hypothetical protein